MPKRFAPITRQSRSRQDFARFYLNLGYAYFGEKNYEDSIASFRKALQIDPDTFQSSPVAVRDCRTGPLHRRRDRGTVLFHAGEIVRGSREMLIAASFT